LAKRWCQRHLHWRSKCADACATFFRPKAMAAAGDFNIKKFDMSKLQDHKTVVVIGRRGVGKTTLIADILYHKRQLPAGIVISGSEDGNGFYRKFIPDSFIYDTFDEEIIKKLIARQKNLTRLKVKDSSVFLLLDDCLFKQNIMKSDTMRYLYMNGRHFGLMVILASQYIMDIPPPVRSNIDYVFIYNDPILANRKRYYDHLFGVFKTFAQFEAVFKACTSKHECLVLDNTVQSTEPTDAIFWYKADIHEHFKIGAPAYWAHHNRTYADAELQKRNDVVTTSNGIRVRKSK
jgi:hypothetical protein